MLSDCEIPVIDVKTLVTTGDVTRDLADQIEKACRENGFFYITGHGIDESLQARLEDLSRTFFELPLEEKLGIRMELGGLAWRGFFPAGDELTSGLPDSKEGIYFGEELNLDHPKVKQRTPLHGANLFPINPPGLRVTVLEYVDAMTRLGHSLIAGISSSLGLNPNYLREKYTYEPLVLFRVFHYPVSTGDSWGVGEHTDYGLLTILKQDSAGGLEIKVKSDWIQASPIEGAFVCNVGDMLERLTHGLYRSTAHRVRASRDHDRLSFAFFFDPNFEAVVEPLPLHQLSVRVAERYERWDGKSVHDFEGTYGEYIVNKVARVFPHLLKESK